LKLNLTERPDETLDTFYKGKILVLQRKNGFRFSVDAPLLASFIQTKMGMKFSKLAPAVE